MIIIDVSIEAEGWPTADLLEDMAQRAISQAIEESDMRLPQSAEVGVIFADDARVQELNIIWRQQDKPTNVLSFAANDGLPRHQWSPLLGDIVLALETISREADEQGKSVDHHLTHLIVHGFLHLVAYDHIEDDQAEAMEHLETAILARLGIADPYTSA